MSSSDFTTAGAVWNDPDTRPLPDGLSIVRGSDGSVEFHDFHGGSITCTLPLSDEQACTVAHLIEMVLYYHGAR